jgi:hypothetical protein
LSFFLQAWREDTAGPAERPGFLDTDRPTGDFLPSAVPATAEEKTMPTEQKKPFDWMSYEVPAAVLERNASHRRDMHLLELRLRARMLRRFGHEADYVVHRCLGNIQWGFELAGEPPVTADEVRSTVDEIFKRPGND